MQMYIREAWYVAAWEFELGPQPLSRTILSSPVVLFRTRDGRATALEDRCCHRGAPLSLGKIVENTIVCGYHGLEFDAIGKCVNIPGQEDIPQHLCVKHYPLVEQDELLWIWMGAPENADPDLIPRFPFHSTWPHKSCTQNLECNYRLVIDNLMDLTHLAFVHSKTVGGDPGAHSTADFEVNSTERGVHFIRWLMNSIPPPTYVQAVGFKSKIDRWMEFEFIAPGIVHQFTGALDAGTGAREKGLREGGFALRIMHAITPETEDSSHYFWSSCHGYRQDQPEVTEQLFNAIASTFEEDALFLKEQHARLREKPTPLFSTIHDRARVMAEHTLNKLLKTERLQKL